MSSCTALTLTVLWHSPLVSTSQLIVVVKVSINNVIHVILYSSTTWPWTAGNTMFIYASVTQAKRKNYMPRSKCSSTLSCSYFNKMNEHISFASFVVCSGIHTINMYVSLEGVVFVMPD